MALLKNFLPASVDELLSLRDDQVGNMLLTYYKTENAVLCVDSIINKDTLRRNEYGADRESEIIDKLFDGHRWLEREDLVARRHDQQPPFFRITGKGQAHDGEVRLDLAAMLDWDSLDPELAEVVKPQFLAANFDRAVSDAFVVMEDRVRRIGNFTANDFGESLMQAAFRVEKPDKHQKAGPLTNDKLVVGEQVGWRSLYAGAYGAFRNPHAHGRQPTTAQEARERIYLANLLLRHVKQP